MPTEPTTIQHAARVAEKATSKTKPENKVVKEWIEIVRNQSNKPGKIVIYRQMTNGLVYSEYVGKESDPSAKGYLAQMKSEGKYKGR